MATTDQYENIQIIGRLDIGLRFALQLAIENGAKCECIPNKTVACRLCVAYTAYEAHYPRRFFSENRSAPI